RGALIEYARDAIELVRVRANTSGALPTLTFHRFVFHGHESMEGIDERRLDWLRILRALAPELSALPSWRRFVEAFRKAPEIASRLEHPFGHSILRLQVRINDFLVDLPLDVLKYGEVTQASPQAIEAAVAGLLRLLSEEPTTILVTAPVVGLELDAEAIKLS